MEVRVDQHGVAVVTARTTADALACSRAGLRRRDGITWYTDDVQGRPSDNPYLILGSREAYSRLPDHYIDHLLAYDDSYAVKPPPGFEVPRPDGRPEYFPSQLAGIWYASQREHTIIGDEPGTGKTILAAGFGNYIGARRVLVIAPACVVLQWAGVWARWNVTGSTAVPVLKGSDYLPHGPSAAIMSYGIAAKKREALVSEPWDLLILDEAHLLKSRRAARTKAILTGDGKGLTPVFSAADRSLALTGTLMPNRPRECYEIVRAACWDAIDRCSIDDMTQRFSPTAKVADREFDAGHAKDFHLRELNARLRCNVMVRRSLASVVDQLPEVSYELVELGDGPAVQHALDAERQAVADGLVALDGDRIRAVAGSGGQFDGQVATIRREMGEALAPSAASYIEHLLLGEVGKVVVAYYHSSVGDLLWARLGERFGAVRVDGRTPQVGRKSAIETFKVTHSCKLFLGQIQACGTGVDGLQEASNVCVVVEPDWAPGNNEQFVARLRRTGQKKPVFARFIVAPGSFSARILAKAYDKLTVINPIVKDILPLNGS